jgi:uncharacterized protein (DUF1810 family)
MADLQRFREAQDDPAAGFDAALREIRSGGKRGHWIWYVFPQIAGLGVSGMSQAYAIGDKEEAEAYLRDETLGGRLVVIAEAVLEALAVGQSLVRVMGSSIDATKLVSSMTLFAGVAQALPRGTTPAADLLRPIAEEILIAADRAGYPRCVFTDRVLAREGGVPEQG